jgi:hypothetical protein
LPLCSADNGHAFQRALRAFEQDVHHDLVAAGAVTRRSAAIRLDGQPTARRDAESAVEALLGRVGGERAGEQADTDGADETNGHANSPLARCSAFWDANMLGKVAGGHYCVRMTMKERNPQAEQMGDESMLRNLAAQAEAIWPQEQRLFDRYQLPGTAHIADIGCGSGEITSRLAALYPEGRADRRWTSWKPRSLTRAGGMRRWRRACDSSKATRSS